MTEQQNPLIGNYIGKYKVEEVLGRGGMAEVYRAKQEKLDRDVAIKLMYPFLAAEENFVKRFTREARAMAGFDHPNIIDVYDFDVFQNRYYIVMQYVAGGTLKDHLADLAIQGRKMPLAQAIQYILEIADALSYAHSFGMIHRDIKPGNIMLNERGQAVLTDFGIAKMTTGTRHTATGAMVGTPAFMSPEQGMGKPGDERADIYSLGVVFYNLVTGQLPFDADSPIALVMKHINEDPPLPSEINPLLPDAIESVILKMLAKEPDDRYEKATDLARHLADAVLRTGDERLLMEVPAALLRERHTPPAGKTLKTYDIEEDPAEPASLAEVVETPEQTELFDPRATEIVDDFEELMAAPVFSAGPPPEQKAGAEVVPIQNSGRRIPWWGWLLILTVFLGGGAGLLFAMGGDDEPEVIAAVSTGTPTLTPSSEPTEEPQAVVSAETAEPTNTPTPAPTDTPLPTRTRRPTSTPTLEPTVDITQVFLDNCNPAFELINAYTYRNAASKSAPVNSSLTLNWVIRIDSDCPVPESLEFQHVAGESFGASDQVPVTLPTGSGEEVTLTVPDLRTPASAGNFYTSWQLVDEEGNEVGQPFDMNVSLYFPPTATPRPPVATPVPAPTATPEVEDKGPVGFNVFFGNCSYGGTEYRCEMTITPFGGKGNEYTIFVFDSDQPTRYFGGNQVHFINARRCFAWIHEVKVQEEVSGESFTNNVYFDPKQSPTFPGGKTCEE